MKVGEKSGIDVPEKDGGMIHMVGVKQDKSKLNQVLTRDTPDLPDILGGKVSPELTKVYQVYYIYIYSPVNDRISDYLNSTAAGFCRISGLGGSSIAHHSI